MANNVLAALNFRIYIGSQNGRLIGNLLAGETDLRSTFTTANIERIFYVNDTGAVLAFVPGNAFSPLKTMIPGEGYAIKGKIGFELPIVFPTSDPAKQSAILASAQTILTGGAAPSPQPAPNPDPNPEPAPSPDPVPAPTEFIIQETFGDETTPYQLLENWTGTTLGGPWVRHVSIFPSDKNLYVEEGVSYGDSGNPPPRLVYYATNQVLAEPFYLQTTVSVEDTIVADGAIGVVWRVNPADATTWYVFRFVRSGTNTSNVVDFARLNNGTFNSIQSSPFTPSPGTPYTLRVEVDGSSMVFRLNGAEVFNNNETAIPFSTDTNRIGVYLENTVDTFLQHYLDSVEAAYL